MTQPIVDTTVPATIPATPVEEEGPDTLDLFLEKWKGKDIPPVELLKAIQEESDLSEEELERIPHLDRAVVGGLTWNKLQAPPGDIQTLLWIVMIFHGDPDDSTDDYVAGDIRIYVAPKAARDLRGDPNPYYCFKLSRVPNAGYTRAAMSLRLFIEQCGQELNRVAVEYEVIDEDDEEPDDPEDPSPSTPADQ